MLFFAFHMSINMRNNGSEIEGLWINNEWVGDVQRVKTSSFDHFKNQQLKDIKSLGRFSLRGLQKSLGKLFRKIKVLLWAGSKPWTVFLS